MKFKHLYMPAPSAQAGGGASAVFRTGDEIAVNDAGATTQDSGSITTQSGDTVYVLVFTSDTTPVAPTGVVWDPTGVNEAFTKVYDPGAADFTNGWMTVWRAQSLTAKTGVIRATWASTQAERGMVTWIGSNINAATPNGTIVAASAADQSVTVTANTTAGQLVLGLAWTFDASVGGPLSFDSPNGTERHDVATSPDLYDAGASQDITAGGATQAITWTISVVTDGWRAVAIPLNNA